MPKKVNINTATKDELKEIREIGDARAGKILKARQEKGKLTLEDLKTIEGLPSHLWDPLVAGGLITFESEGDKPTVDATQLQQTVNQLSQELFMKKQAEVTLKKELTDLENNVKLIREAHEEKVKEYEEEIHNLNGQLQTCAKQVNLAHDKKQEWEQRFDKSSKEIADLQEEIQTLQDKLQQVPDSDAEMQKGKVALKKLEDENIRLTQELREKNSNINQLRSEIHGKSQELEDQFQRIQTLEVELREKDSKINSFQSDIRIKNQELEDQYQRNRMLDMELDVARTSRRVSDLAPQNRYTTGSRVEAEATRRDDRAPRSSTNTNQHPRVPQQPQFPKLSTYDGTGDWKSYFLQFEHTARRFEWTDQQKMDNFLLCLRGKALKYFSTRPTEVQNNFQEMTEKMKQRFGQKELPHSIRRQLMSIKQNADESLEDFAERVQEMATDGYSDTSDEIVEVMAVEAFLKGCLDTKAALSAMDKNPQRLDQALQFVKSAIYNHRVIIGHKKMEVRKVHFEGQSDDSEGEEFNTNTVRFKERYTTITNGADFKDKQSFSLRSTGNGGLQ